MGVGGQREGGGEESEKGLRAIVLVEEGEKASERAREKEREREEGMK